MPAKIFSASLLGFDAHLVEVEVDILNGMASITIVGLGDTAIQEAKERIRSAIKNSGAEYPRRKKTINLAPADLRKHGPMFDLAIALGLLIKSGQIPQNSINDTLVVGELALSGHLRRIAGVLPIAAFAMQKGFKNIIVPAQNAPEAGIVNGINIIPAENLSVLISHLKGQEKIPPYTDRLHKNIDNYKSGAAWHFEDIRGHEYTKRALTIAASGSHNVLLYGPPGSGKTLLARSMQSILPPMTFEESVEVTKIYSIAGKLPPEESLIYLPPFRAVHHTASTISLVGGGAIPRPGEISLSHKGILFLDELLEFPRVSLDCLRQPMEDGAVNVSRAAGSYSFPADFTLIAATNPCICGYFGDQNKPCICTPSQLQNYHKKLSGPLLDRIDLMCYVPRLPFETIISHSNRETSENTRKTVMTARQLQMERQNNILNGRASSGTTTKHCALDSEASALLKNAFLRFHFSGRAYHRILKVARTIADLENSREIAAHHLAEALQYRPKMFDNLSDKMI